MFSAPFVILGMVGAVLLALDRAMIAQLLWMVANIGLAVWNVHIGQGWQAAYFIFMFLFAALGVAIQWAKDRRS
jgi:hypothetical protein